MITAQEAKRLYDESGKEIQDFIKFTVEKEVIKAATSGKRQVSIHLGSIEMFYHLDQEITPLQKGVVAALKDLGYQVDIRLDGEPYVPRGLADDDGKGPQHRNYVLSIGW
jgi:hypothetical protein